MEVNPITFMECAPDLCPENNYCRERQPRTHDELGTRNTVFSTPEILSIAENLLSERFGGAQKLLDNQELSGSGHAKVIRAKVASSPLLQHRSVILKYIPDSEDFLDDASLLREVVAYQFTNSLAEDIRPGPVLLAHDITRRILVITDSGDGDTFDSLLATKEVELRAQILRNLGRALGKMHAGTAGREKDFHILLSRMLRAHPDTAELQELRDHSLVESIRIGAELLNHVGLQVPATVAELSEQAQRRLDSGQHRAFTPFDLSPDNIIVAERTHFLDYEWAGFRDATFDVACVVAGFPQYVGSLPISDDEADLFIEAWVQEVRSLWPNVTNEERLHNRIVAALIGWAMAGVSLMCFGSLSNAMALEHEEDQVIHLLRTPDEGPFSTEEEIMRRDLYETFEALGRFAARGTDSRMPEVAHFARSVADRLAEAPR